MSGGNEPGEEEQGDVAEDERKLGKPRGVVEFHE
jgi:hypothetical protein